MDSKKYIEHIYRRFLDDRATPEEVDKLLQYVERSEPEDVQHLIRMGWSTSVDSDFEIDVAGFYAQIQTRLQPRDIKQKSVRLIRHRRWVPYVAAVLLFFVLGGYFYIWRSQESVSTEELTYTNDVLPGGNRAQITFSNGERLELDSTQSSLMTVDGSYVYSDGKAVTLQAAEYATVQTPIGGTYQVTLPDGTKVWLNAASSITYPTYFTGGKREIETTGEVYFEVVHDVKNPFIVLSKNQRIQVLGTAFNVNSYNKKLVTTLVEGRVSLSAVDADSNSSDAVFLSPGQQAVLIDQKVKVSTVEVSEYIAWKEGMFRFKSTPLPEALQQLERWYDLEIEYYDIPKEILVHASIKRDKKLSSILYALEEISNVKFKIQGRRLVLMK
ncbi:FecR family protein [Sphingobacterium faecale]|uniref:FecR domain-containing protein n=1 Tax=Sphingobacterium faecale TaxID=2803775 RepID=A0ABS1R9P8_9SPHI|nr:FecR family protein [Sphingobacterium faecale]MBL1411441.1 FecR domain-containing protein [Sphingobacterium faecale]